MMFDFRHWKIFGIFCRKTRFSTRPFCQKLTFNSQKTFSTNCLPPEKRFPLLASRRIVVFTLQNALSATRVLPDNAFPPSASYLKLYFKPGKSLYAIRLSLETAVPQPALPLIFDYRHEKMFWNF